MPQRGTAHDVDRGRHALDAITKCSHSAAAVARILSKVIEEMLAANCQGRQVGRAKHTNYRLLFGRLDFGKILDIAISRPDSESTRKTVHKSGIERSGNAPEGSLPAHFVFFCLGVGSPQTSLCLVASPNVRFWILHGYWSPSKPARAGFHWLPPGQVLFPLPASTTPLMQVGRSWGGGGEVGASDSQLLMRCCCTRSCRRRQTSRESTWRTSA